MTWWQVVLCVLYLLMGAFVFHMTTKMFDDMIKGLPTRPLIMFAFYMWLFVVSCAWPAVFIYHNLAKGKDNAER